MFEKVIIALILVLAAVLVFSGCTTAEKIEDAAESKADAVEDMIESKFNAVEDADEKDLVSDPALAASKSEDVALTDNSEQGTTISAVPVTNPAQESIDKVADILGDILKEQASTLHISDSVVDSAVSAPYGQTVFITPEAAKQIALDHAGVAAADVVFDSTERDFDNGVYHYEIEFRVDYTEYEYDIDALTGKILSFDQDR